MQRLEPRCSERQCRYFAGIREIEIPGDPAFKHVPVCSAFPDGIPDEIAYGTNDHTEPFAGDNGIRYERAPVVE